MREAVGRWPVALLAFAAGAIPPFPSVARPRNSLATRWPSRLLFRSGSRGQASPARRPAHHARTVESGEAAGRPLPAGGRRLAASRSVAHPTRLETRTKESNMRASRWVLDRPGGAMKVKATPAVAVLGLAGLVPAKHQRPVPEGLLRGGVGAHTLGPERW